MKVKVVPHIDSLRIKDLHWFLEKNLENSIDYLPEDYQKKPLNRQWLWNLCIQINLISIDNTFNSKEFQELIDKAIKEREHKYLEKYSMVIETDPRIVSAFQKSSFNYCIVKNFVNYIAAKGRSHMLIRKNKSVARNRNVLEEEKEELMSEDEKNQHIKRLQKEIEDLL